MELRQDAKHSGAVSHALCPTTRHPETASVAPPGRRKIVEVDPTLSADDQATRSPIMTPSAIAPQDQLAILENSPPLLRMLALGNAHR